MSSSSAAFLRSGRSMVARSRPSDCPFPMRGANDESNNGCPEMLAAQQNGSRGTNSKCKRARESRKSKHRRGQGDPSHTCNIEPQDKKRVDGGLRKLGMGHTSCRCHRSLPPLHWIQHTIAHARASASWGSAPTGALKQAGPVRLGRALGSGAWELVSRAAQSRSICPPARRRYGGV